MKTFSFRLIAVALLFVSVAAAWPTTASALSIKEGEPAPTFTLGDLDGNQVSLDDYKGKVVLLAFWASWCPRCMEELMFLQGMYTGLKNDLVVLAVNQDTKNLSATHVEKLRAETQEMGLTFPILLDLEFEVWQNYGINALPTSVILDREGKVVFAEPNYYWASQKKIRDVLNSLGIDAGSAD